MRCSVGDCEVNFVNRVSFFQICFVIPVFRRVSRTCNRMK